MKRLVATLLLIAVVGMAVFAAPVVCNFDFDLGENAVELTEIQADEVYGKGFASAIGSGVLGAVSSGFVKCCVIAIKGDYSDPAGSAKSILSSMAEGFVSGAIVGFWLPMV